MGNPEAKPRAADFEAAYPTDLRDDEIAKVGQRRKKVAPGSDRPDPDTWVAVGVSGGGIRSATFALGVFQSLARFKLLRKIDLLSTVSGGGYFGSFLGRIFTRPDHDSPEKVEKVLASSSGPVRFLRENGRYLAPKGGGDLLVAGSSMFRNWVAVQVVLLSAILTSVLAVRLVESFSIIREKMEWLARGCEYGVAVVTPWKFGAVLPAFLAAVVFVFCVVPLGWSYFALSEKRDSRTNASTVKLRIHHAWPVTVVALAAMAFSYLTHGKWPDAGWTVAIAILAVVPLIAIACACSARQGGKHVGMSKEEREEEKNVASCSALRASRSRASRWLKSALVAVAVLLALALVGSLGAWFHEQGLSGGGKKLITMMGGLAGAMAFGKELLMRFGGQPGAGRPKLPLSIGAYVVAGAIVLAIFVAADATSRALVDVDALRRIGWLGKTGWERWWPASAFLLWLGLTVALGHSIEFVNLSSHHSLYSQRLTRAYLGASNPSRLSGKVALTDVTRGDDVTLPTYYEAVANAGAPLHLINVTINETFDPKAEVQNQDRKGVPLAIGPCGVSVGVRHHALHVAPKRLELQAILPAGVSDWKKVPYHVFVNSARVKAPASHDGKATIVTGAPIVNPELLRLGQWTAISGAAFSTGIGARTNLGLSLLCGLANVRLGYWWNAGVGDRGERAVKDDRPAGRKLWGRLLRWLSLTFPAHSHLFSEFLSRFLGTASKRWYLSDGGHFENLGGYELVRRRQKFILLVDDEADPEFAYDGLANLIRKARVDFGAEIRFLDERQLNDALAPAQLPLFGPLERRREDGRSRAHAALATVTYADESRGVLLYLKATLTGDEPQDVLAYHRQHEEFPHETTADQFFDEAQWESYRALGEHIAEQLFGGVNPPVEADGIRAERTWVPRDLFDGMLPAAPTRSTIVAS